MTTPQVPATRTHPPVNEAAQTAMARFHADTLTEVQAAIRSHHIVVVGMAQNPFVRKAKTFLREKGLPFHSIDYGSYFSGWKPRLAIKMWSGWPTFPQVFVNGTLIGGFAELKAAAAEGELTGTPTT